MAGQRWEGPHLDQNCPLRLISGLLPKPNPPVGTKDILGRGSLDICFSSQDNCIESILFCFLLLIWPFSLTDWVVTLTAVMISRWQGSNSALLQLMLTRALTMLSTVLGRRSFLTSGSAISTLYKGRMPSRWPIPPSDHEGA